MIPEKAIRSVLKAVDYDALIQLAQDLVKINSVWNPDAGSGEQEVAEFVASWAGKRMFEFQMEQVAPGRPNVIIPWQAGAGERTLMFEAHTDVVTPGDLSAWTYDPFGAQIVRDRMYGRGANDTKGNLAAMLIAIQALKTSGVELCGGIVAGVLCDEEGLMSGILDFIEKGHADAVTAAVICEPQDGRICTAQKGAIRACYTILGHMSHGAMPLTGVNTAPAIAGLIEGLHQLELKAVETFGRDDLLGWPSFTPTVIQVPSSGPPQLNVMPGKGHVMVDIRTIPGQYHEEIRDALRKLASNVEAGVRDSYRSYDRLLDLSGKREITINVTFLTDRPCTDTDKGDPVVQSADWATRKRMGIEPVYDGVPGATDGTFLWALKQIPIVTMGAGDRNVPHQIDEWVDIEQLKATADIYALTALHYLFQGDGCCSRPC